MKIELKNIIVPESFKESTPAKSKIDTIRGNYEEFGCPFNLVVLSDNNVLLDGYITYLVAKEMELASVPFKRGQLGTIEGVHEGGNKLYEWKIPPSERRKVKVGRKVSVWTKYGATRVQVLGIKSYSHVEPDRVLRSMCRSKTIFRVRGSGSVEVVDKEECAKRGIIDGEPL